MSTIEKDNKVKCPDGNIGYVTDMRLVEAGAVAKVVTEGGFENWYSTADLEKLPYKERYVNHY